MSNKTRNLTDEEQERLIELPSAAKWLELSEEELIAVTRFREAALSVCVSLLVGTPTLKDQRGEKE